MKLRSRRLIVSLSFLAAAAVGIGLLAKRRTHVEFDRASPPAAYSARVVRTMETEASRYVTESLVTRMNDLVREEWTELNKRKVMIWRPDLGKILLLAPDERSYSESVMSGVTTAEARSDGSALASSLDPNAIERDLPAAAPVRVDTVVIEGTTIDGHPCDVSERRLAFGSGHVEVTRTFRARDLGGLPIRIETFSQGASELPKLTIEIRDLSTDVKSADFDVPAGYARSASRRIGAPPSGAAWR